MQTDATGYQVRYNGTTMSVNASITTLIFTAPSLPADVITGTIVVIVTALSKYGIGPASDPVAVIITSKYIAAYVVNDNCFDV